MSTTVAEMTERRRSSRPKTLVVALDANAHGVEFLESAASIAERLRADLKAVLVEDESLLRLAELPFAQEVNRTSGIGRALDAGQLNRLLRARTRQLQSAIDRFSASGRVSAQLQIVRGHYLSAALSVASSKDVLLLDSAGRKLTVFEPYRMTRDHASAALQPKALYRRVERGACHVLYDGTDAASRALDMAASFSAAVPATLTVLIASGSASEAALLRIEANKRLGGLSASLRYLDMPVNDGSAVVQHLRRCGCGLLIAPRGDSKGVSAGVMALLKELDCPLILVG